MPDHVSVSEKRRVEAAIEAKLEVLRRWSKSIPWRANSEGEPVRDKNGELVLEYFPTSVDSFCAWDGTQNSSFVRNRENLNFAGPSRSAVNSAAHDTSRGLLKKIFPTLEARASHQRLVANKANLISRLLRERSWQRKLIHQQETEIAVLLDEVTMSGAELQSERATRKNNEEQLLARIEQLETRNAELATIARKVTPLASSERRHRESDIE
ncbi:MULTISPECIES: hypothetical protein [unclassified Caballeronia]|uniref:hypothetical protein n=1 Tax=unclassified Caballeronia TaxID=2646786 RepID=UPI002028D581|nr:MULTISPECIES: hypothetical protein [unclassified Caballeronia]MDR5765907.1 hypothetical protein [Caballeronia sp. LZ028]